MHQQRKLPTKRYSSYNPTTQMLLEDHVSSIGHRSPASAFENDEALRVRNNSVACSTELNQASRRKSLNTLHFDALQSAVSKLSRIDDYNLEELGYGFFSDVFKVTHKQSGKIMVLKRNKTTNTKMNILREVQLMNRLAHPNILKFMGVCVHEGQLHALTEYINGGDVDQLIQKDEYLSWTTRVRLAHDVSKGLQYLHSMGIFHRDLTAKNCLVRVTPTLKQKKKYSAVLADLGLAEKIPTKPEEKARLKIVGTPYCMAPEVLCSKPYDERSDFFSFGLLICQLIIRTSSDPEKLPRSNDFGLNQELFSILVKNGVGAPEITNGNLPTSMPPTQFLQLAYDCCEIDPIMRPNVKEIVETLEKTIADAKAEQQEKKELARVKATSKRRATADAHSINLMRTSRLRSCTADFTEQTGNSNGASTSPHKVSLTGMRARLSRSSSDVSKELISQAASVIASSKINIEDGTGEEDIDNVIHTLSEAFINPFSNLEDASLLEKKLFDLPSLEVLEMAFDLPAPSLSSSGNSTRSSASPIHRRRKQKPAMKSERPKSLLLSAETATCENSAILTPELRSDTQDLSLLCENSNSGSDLFLNDVQSPKPSHDDCSTFDHRPTESSQINLKHALIRSAVFSPQGCRIMSRWNHNSRLSDWRSISSLLSIMTKKVDMLKRSISVPDLSRYSGSSVLKLPQHDSLLTDADSRSSSISSDQGCPKLQSFKILSNKVDPAMYPVYVTLPRKKKSRCHSSTTDAARKLYPKVSDDSLPDGTLETLREESSETPGKSLVNSSKPPISPKREINNNSTTHRYSPKKTLSPRKSCGCPNEKGEQLPLEIKLCSGQIEGNDSSASSSSGTSSVGLQMSLQTGAVSCSRRSKMKVRYKEDEKESGKQTKRSENSQGCEAVSPRSNRDSGYNDDAFSVDSSCDSLSSTNTVSSDINHHNFSNSDVVAYTLKYQSKVIPYCKIQEENSTELNLLGKTH